MRRTAGDRHARALQATSGASALGALVASECVLADQSQPQPGERRPDSSAASAKLLGPAPVSPAGGLLTRSAHVAFEGCTAKNITLSVSIARTSFLIGQPVTYAGRPSGTMAPRRAARRSPASRTRPENLTVGPCGQVSSIVVNASGHNVYPGREVVHCPMYFGAASRRARPVDGRGELDG